MDVQKLRKLILATVEDGAADMLYYDRKEDEDLPAGAIEKAIRDGVITADELVEAFRKILCNSVAGK